LNISSVLWIDAPKLLFTGTAAVKQRKYGRQQCRAGKWLVQVDAVGNKGRSLPYAVLVLRSDEDPGGRSADAVRWSSNSKADIPGR